MEPVLDERIRRELIDLKQSLERDGKLLSDDQLAYYYETFRNRFGPDKLGNLDGEALLEAMHSFGNKDSLVYWLEFKDDEELPGRFGSIAGGSAFKFGLFRRKETGRWATGSSSNPVELSVEQAIEIARQHRDQLIKGAELLEHMPRNGSDADYAHLQQEMESMGPVGNSSWGHKYFSLLHPDKLDDFHNPEYQRFNLVKLLQLPPPGQGRYIVAGRYVAIARELNLQINNLTTMLYSENGSPYSYWRIGTSAFKAGDHWEKMRDGNYVAVGWSEIGDLTGITNDKKGKEDIRQALLSHGSSTNPSALGRSAQQIFNFRWTIAMNDLVLASNGATVLGLGRVTGGYIYEPSRDFPHLRPVEWLSLEPWQQPDQHPDIEGKLTTVYKMRREANLLEAERHIYGASPIISTLSTEEPKAATTPLQPLALPRLTGIPARIQAILERKGQVILYGPPGTGKTYWAEYTARELAARSRFGIPFDQLSTEQQKLLLGDGDHVQGNVRMCSFHPAYGYEDFLEGFRPEPVNGQMQFVPRDGIFKQLCKDALTSPAENFYLIIDEINRGDIPRIFGELLTVLEKDKRGKSILLPLTNTPFKVPENVYIIGTMNTADRSIALLDTALRRRFGFIELMPDSDPLKHAAVGGIPLGLWLEALNERIREHVGRDARNLQIGHAYFLEKEQPITDPATFARVIQDDLLPLLEEYCYEDYAKLEKILGSGLVDARNQSIRHELFAASQQPELIQALLAPSPEIITSAPAAAIEAQASEEQLEEEGSDDDESENQEA